MLTVGPLIMAIKTAEFQAWIVSCLNWIKINCYMNKCKSMHSYTPCNSNMILYLNSLLKLGDVFALLLLIN